MTSSSPPSTSSPVLPHAMNSSAPYTPYNPRLKRASTPQQSNSRSATPVSSPAGARRVGTPEPAVAAFPFQAVPSGSSPFPPSTPSGSTTPIRNGTPVAGGSSNGFLVRAQSPSLANGGQSAGKEAERTPYRSGFQPQGVRRDRTEEFAGKRKSRSDGKKLEEGRLGRRMEKVRERTIRLFIIWHELTVCCLAGGLTLSTACGTHIRSHSTSATIKTILHI